MNELHLFAGAGGGILGGMLCGHTCVCAVEIKPYRRKVLLQRQRDGILPRFPLWDDVATFDGRPWRGIVDVVCGGFPCQDISAAGKGVGIRGARSGLWTEFVRIVGEVQPRYILVENSPMLTLRGIDVVIGDISSLGYDARWGIVSAADAGAPHKRERIWIVANSTITRSRRLPIQQRGQKQAGIDVDGSGEDVSNTESTERERNRQTRRRRLGFTNGDWWKTEPGLGRVADGVANRVDRIGAIGDGQVPAVVKLAWDTLMGGER